MSASCKIVLQSSKLTLLSSSVVPGHAFSPPHLSTFQNKAKKEIDVNNKALFWIYFSRSINIVHPKD